MRKTHVTGTIVKLYTDKTFLLTPDGQPTRVPCQLSPVAIAPRGFQPRLGMHVKLSGHQPEGQPLQVLQVTPRPDAVAESSDGDIETFPLLLPTRRNLAPA